VSSIAFLIEQTALALYIFIGVGLVMYVRQWLLAGYELRATMFELERDYAREKRVGAMFAIVLLVEAGLIVAGVQQVVAPTIREDREVQEAILAANMPAEDDSDDGVFATSTPPAVAQGPEFDTSDIELGVDDQAAVFVTPTLTPTPVGTIEPNPPPVNGCDQPYATLQIPANGMRVFQPIRVAGVAYFDDFSEYKIEIAGPTTQGQFWTVDTKPLPSANLATLSQFDPDGYEPGEYQFRLMVFDTTATLVASCEVTIYIDRPQPTPTPLSGE
jgi:hypothetical protein